MAEWLYEAGIGEARAILIADGAIVEACIELPGLRAGTIAEARLTAIPVPGRRGIATLGDGTEVLIEPLPKVTEGAAVRIDIIREAIHEPGARKRARGRLTALPLRAGPDLATRIGEHRVIGVRDPDLFEHSGWSECLEDAATGIVAFAGGTLRIALTPAMTLIDVDGDDAAAAATAVARTIRRLGISGNIGIDFPTVAGKSARQAIAAAFDAALVMPFERTAVNGFGFLQVIRPRVRASLCEIIRNDQADAAARALLRRAERSALLGHIEITAAPQVIAAIECSHDWPEQLSHRTGGPVSLRADPGVGLSSGSIHRIS